MSKVVTAVLVVATLAGATSLPARAGDGANFAAGLLGGLAAGAIVGAAVSQPPYAPPPPVYVAPEPIDGPACYWTHGEPYWDGYRGAWIYPRVRVCE